MASETDKPEWREGYFHIDDMRSFTEAQGRSGQWQRFVETGALEELRAERDSLEREVQALRTALFCGGLDAIKKYNEEMNEIERKATERANQLRDEREGK